MCVRSATPEMRTRMETKMRKSVHDANAAVALLKMSELSHPVAVYTP